MSCWRLEFAQVQFKSGKFPESDAPHGGS